MEFALITPILLLLILGMLQVGLGMLTSVRLTHAATQASIASDCDEGLARVPVIYGSDPDEADCSLTDGVLEIRLVDAAPFIGPWGVWNVQASGRSVTASPTPMESD